MKHQSIASETLRLLDEVDVFNGVRGLVAEPGFAIGAPWTHRLRQGARIRSDERSHVHSRRKNISWFLGLYATSLLSMSGLIGGVRWMVAFL